MGPNFGRRQTAPLVPTHGSLAGGRSQGAGVEVAEGHGLLGGDGAEGMGLAALAPQHPYPHACGGHKLEDSLDLAGSVSGMLPTESLRAAAESCCRVGAG